ncbi:MAG: 50S ribosomal protein L10 [Patescibacteria group bacterium]
MSLTKDQKAVILDKLTEILKKAKSVVFSGYQGISVKDLQAIRKELRKNGAQYFIAKKTLMRIAGRRAGMPDVPDTAMDGAVGIAVGFQDEVAPARVLHTFSKKIEAIKLLGGIMDGKVMSLDEVKFFATLPGREELIAKVLYMFKSPISGFHGVLHGLLRNFVCGLSEVAKKKA